MQCEYAQKDTVTKASGCFFNYRLHWGICDICCGNIFAVIWKNISTYSVSVAKVSYRSLRPPSCRLHSRDLELPHGRQVLGPSQSWRSQSSRMETWLLNFISLWYTVSFKTVFISNKSLLYGKVLFNRFYFWSIHSLSSEASRHDLTPCTIPMVHLCGCLVFKLCPLPPTSIFSEEVSS